VGIDVFKVFQTKTKRKAPGRPVLLGQDSIVLEGISIEYFLKRSHRAKLIWLTYKPRCGLQVTVPPRYNLKDLPDFLRRNARWILRHQSASQLIPGSVEKPSRLGDTVLFLGKPLQIVRQTGAAQNNVNFDGSQLMINIKTDADNSERLVFNWMKDQAVRLISEKVKLWSSRLKVEFRRITIRNQKSRWGSCSRLRNLSFNWRLIMVPEEVLEYVIVHELCHLKEMNHQKAFWKIVATYCPQWREHRRWLNHHRLELHSQVDI
jgi:predicted metal-dependent hydrolase